MEALTSFDHWQPAQSWPVGRDFGKTRMAYLAFGCGLILIYILLKDVPWQGNPQLHTFMEIQAALLALLVAVLALARFYRQRQNAFLLLGAAFGGTALLDGYNAIVTSEYLAPHLPSALPSLIPWSWFSSRLFLSIMMSAVVLASDQKQRPSIMRRVNKRGVIFAVATFTLCSLAATTLVSLPQGYYPDLFFHRPEEFVPGIIFFFALVVCFRGGRWKLRPFDHWLIFSLIISVVSQNVVMPFSATVFDLEFALAYLLKIASYLCVASGVLSSMYFVLRQEIENRKRTEVARKNGEEELATKSKLLETTLESMSHGITVHDADGKLISFNQKSIDLRNYPPGFIRLGMNMNEAFQYKAETGYYGSDNVEAEVKSRQKRNRRKERFYQERVRANGTVVAMHREPMPDGGFVTTYTDISELKRMEQSLRESEERFRKAFHDTSVGMAMRNVNDRTLITNLALYRMLGYSHHELEQMSLGDLTHPDDREMNDAGRQQLRAGGAESFNINKRMIRKDGTVIWVNEDMSTIRDDRGNPLFTVSLYQDITELKRAEREAAQTSNFLTKTFDTVAQGLAIYDAGQKLVKFNSGFEKLFGFPKGFLKIGMSLSEIVKFRHERGYFGDIDLDTIMGQIKENSKRHHHGERCLPDGTAYILDAKPLDGGGFVISYIDITEHKESERSLRKAEAYLRTITENVADALITINQRGIVESFNHAAEGMFGYEAGEVIGRNIKVLMPEEYASKHDDFLRDYLRTGRSKIIDIGPRELTGKRKDGSEFPMELSVSIVTFDGKTRFIGSTRDVTWRKKQEEQRSIIESELQQSRKMEAIGTLAGGIAHDFNNTLTPIMGLTSLMLDDLPENHPNRENLERVLRAADRARRLVRQILDFSRSNTFDREPLRLQIVLEDAVQLLNSGIPSTIRIKAKLDDIGESVLANESQIHQVVMNLATNAAGAIGRKGGVIKISLRQCDLDTSFTHLHPDLRPGKWARISVEDTGCGMEKETMDRMFEPFFTTKAVNEGTGLGLATVHGIVVAHGGSILVSSEVGIGTKFDVYLPMLKDHQDGLDEADDQNSQYFIHSNAT